MNWLTPSKLHIKKPNRFNPHQFWIVLLSGFLLALTAELFYFSWFFLSTSKTLDEPALPNLETNATRIKNLENKLKTIETAIEGRTGTSQNSGALVQ